MTVKQTVLLLICFSVVGAIYSLGSNGSLYYDDARPIGNLSAVVDFKTALNYVVSESSGPIGRPISMITFLPHVYHWPESTEPFFWFNIILHLFCGFLVFVLTKLILRLIDLKSPVGSHFSIAVAATILWLILPIHAATVLVAIQRMAQLSTFFMLIGLCIYLMGLLKQQQFASKHNSIELKYAIIWQITGLVGGTFFAILSKENGILLPAIILVLEITLLQNCVGLKKYRNIRVYIGLLGLASVFCLLLVYHIKTGNYPEGRDFTTFQRLISQPLILLEYVRLAFLPVIQSINPFHDNYAYSTRLFEFKTLAATLILIGLMTLSILLRKTTPLFSFAVLWFFVAHLIESTSIALELVFLHRNYFALIGPVVAMAIGAAKLKKVTTIRASFISYALVLSFILGLTTNLWGNKSFAAESWFIAQEGSVRANEHLSNMLLKAERFEESANVTRYLADKCKECAGTKLQHVVSICLAGNSADANHVLTSVEEVLVEIKNANRIRGLPDQLVTLETFRMNGTCSNINAETLYNINLALLNHKLSHLFNPLRLVQNMYEISVEENEYEDAERLILQAWTIKKQVPIAAEMVTTFNTLGKTDKSIALVDKICSTPNYFGPYRLTHDELCSEFKKLLDVEKHTHES